MKEPEWIEPDLVPILHARSLQRFGGLAGARDEGLLASALARPRHLWAYGETNLFVLAAALGGGVIRNHPMNDGNKRLGFGLTLTFLLRNGYRLTASNAEATRMTLALAAGEVDEVAYGAWLAANALPVARAAPRPTAP